jgi:anti-sigma factor RsiW
MSTHNHPIEQEELMAYLDGELATNRAVAAAAHLEHCAECQELAGDLRKLSQQMMAWEVEDIEPSAGTPIKAALQDRPGKPRKAKMQLGWRILLTRRGLVWAGGGAVAVLFLMIFSFSPMKPARMAQSSKEMATPKLENYYGSLKPVAPSPRPNAAAYLNGSINGNVASGSVSDQDVTRGRKTEGASEGDEIDSSELEVPSVPMIARTAGLTLTTKEFDKTRADLEEILKRHSGYMGELKVNAPTDAGRSLTATLRIPAAQLDAAMAELKKLGRVENESQGGEEVTQQYVDLRARLANGIHTEQRLTEILRTRTGKLQDVLKVELEIDRVRGEIEQMQAEKKELSKRVAFATLNTTVQEEYFARLQGTPPSTGSRFRNAAVDGYNTVVEGLIDVGLFLLSAGPSLLLWAAILFFPARWVWKKLRHKFAEPDEPSGSVT